jgi:hypothetical protein
MQDKTAPSPALTPSSAHKPSGAFQAISSVLPIWGMLLMLIMLSYPLMNRDLWTDEAYTISYAAHPTISALLDDVTKNEETPPIYFVSVWLWARAIGTSETSIRTLSVIYGAGAILGFAAFIRQRLTTAGAVVAVSLFAASPLLQRYLIEARGYTLTVLLTVVCIAMFEHLYRRPEILSSQVAYALSAAALVLTSYFSVALLVAQWLTSLTLLLAPATRRARLVGWVIVQAIIAAFLLPWLPFLRYQMLVSQAVTADWSSGIRDYYFLAFGSLMGTVLPGLWFIGWLTAAAAGFTLMLASGLGDRTTGGLIVRSLALPGFVLILLVMLMQVVATRYLIVILPGSAIAAGAGFMALRRHRPWLAWLLVALLAIGMLLTRVGAESDDATGAWDRLTARVAAKADSAGDIVLFHPPWDQRIFEYYYHGPQMPMAGAHNYDDFYYSQGYTLRKTWTLSEALPVIRGHRRAWVIYDQLHYQVPPLDLPYQQLGHWSEGRLELFLYDITAPHL